MKLPLLPLSLALATLPALASACPWAGGQYNFKESGISGTFTVNGECTEMVWKRLQEPQTTALARTKHGWKGSLTKVDVELLENGSSLRIFDVGVMRQATAKRVN